MPLIKKITIKNFLQLENLEVEPGKVTILEGGNEAGKSSSIKALQNLIEGGWEAELVRRGSEQAETILVLDDDRQFRKRGTAQGGDLQLKDPSNKKPGPPKSILNEMVDRYSVNPSRLLKADARERVDYVLSALPLEADFDLLESIAGEKVDRDLHPLKAIADVRAELYAKRTRAHAVLDDKTAHVNELRESMPAGRIADVTEELAAAREASLIDVREFSAKKVDLNSWSARVTRIAELDFNEAQTLADYVLESRIAALRAKHTEEIDKLRSKLNDELLTITRTRDEQIREIDQQLAAKELNSVASIADLEARVSRYSDYRNLCQLLDREVERAEAAQKEWDDLQHRISQIDNYKKQLAATLPIAGLEVQDGDLLVNGTVWRHVNTAQQIDVIFQICEFRSRGLDFMLFDGLEALDTANRKIFIERGLKSSKQIFATRVTDGPLTVQTYSI